MLILVDFGKMVWPMYQDHYFPKCNAAQKQWGTIMNITITNYSYNLKNGIIEVINIVYEAPQDPVPAGLTVLSLRNETLLTTIKHSLSGAPEICP